MEGAAPIKVMIVDDHPMVRQGLRTFFSTCDDIEVVAEAGNGLEALQKCVADPSRRGPHGHGDARHGRRHRHRQGAGELSRRPGDRAHQLRRPGHGQAGAGGRRHQLPAQGRQPRQAGRRHPPGPPGQRHHRFQRGPGADGRADGGPDTPSAKT